MITFKQARRAARYDVEDATGIRNGRLVCATVSMREVTYCGQPMFVDCDRNCAKAWGINVRPRAQLSDDPDDYAFLADNELGDAPIDPGTYEGDHAKPLTPDAFPNKWCVRQCERCGGGRTREDAARPEFSRRHYNQPWKHAVPSPDAFLDSPGPGHGPQ